MSRAALIVARANSRVEEICAAFPPIQPGPQYWLESDAGPNYCRDCAIVARGWEFELGPLLSQSDRWYNRSDWEDCYLDGIDGGRDIESDSAAACNRCGKTLSYILTDYGAEQEASYYLEAPLIELRGEDSYALDRLTLNMFDGMSRDRLLMIAAAVGQAYRLLGRTPA